MNLALVLLLAFVWAAVLLPGALRSRRGNTHATVGGFAHAMDVLRQRPSGRELLVPADAGRIVGVEARAELWPGGSHRIDPMLERRRRVFARLLGGTFTALALAVFTGSGPLWTLTVLLGGALGGYVALLRRWKRQRDQARRVVRELRRPRRDDPRGVVDAPPRAVGENPVQVATHPSEPWAASSGVRIRRWED